MVAVFPCLMVLGDSNTWTVTKHRDSQIITEEDYFRGKNALNDRFKDLYCPTCDEKGGLFKGFYYIQCISCLNLYLSDKDEIMVN